MDIGDAERVLTLDEAHAHDFGDEEEMERIIESCRERRKMLSVVRIMTDRTGLFALAASQGRVAAGNFLPSSGYGRTEETCMLDTGMFSISFTMAHINSLLKKP